MFAGTQCKPRLFYSDNARELVKAARVLGWDCRDTCTPCDSQSNAIAERQIRHTKEGARCNLMASGLPSSYWPLAIMRFCDMANISLSDGDSAYNRRFKRDTFRAS